MRLDTIAIAACIAASTAACRDGASGFTAPPVVPLTASPRQLTYNTADDVNPSWSANSDTVFYTAVSFVDFPTLPHTLLRIARDGGIAELLAPGAQPNGATALVLPVLAPTKDRIAYVQLARPLPPAVCGNLVNRPECANSEPLIQSGTLRVRTLAANTPAGNDAGVVVPFQGVDPSRSAGGLGPFQQKLFPYQAAHRNLGTLLFRPTWSPDGQQLAFSDGLALRLWTPSQTTSMVIPNTSDGVSPAWSPTGNQIAFTRLVRGDSVQFSCGCNEPGTNAAPPPVHVRWTYTVSRTVIVLINADGSSPVELTDGSEPAWSPDGSTLYFARGNDIYRIPRAGGVATIIAQTNGGRSPSVSPDGKWLAFSRPESADTNSNIWVLSLSSQ